jgi:hypothetical protein
MFIVMDMHNDKHDGASSPTLRRSVFSTVVSLVTLVGAACFGLLSALDTANTISSAGDGRVSASIPVPDAALSGALSAAAGATRLSGTTFVEVSVSDVPSGISSSFVLGHAIGLVAVLALALIVVVTALGTVAGRMRWGLLSGLMIMGGTLMGVGAVLSQLLLSSAAEDLSVWLLSAEDPWLEPGLFAGIDSTGVVAGAAFVVLGLAFRASARFARDADGVV